MNFFWKELERQVRITGTIEKISAADSETYFKSRPKESQIGAWSSPQSRIIPDRSFLEEVFAEHKDKSDTKPALIHVPISDEFMETDKGKDLFVDEMLPMVAKKVVEDFKVYAIAWSSEAWMRMADKDDDIVLSRFRVVNSDLVNTVVNQFTIRIKQGNNILETFNIDVDDLPYSLDRNIIY